MKFGDCFEVDYLLLGNGQAEDLLVGEHELEEGEFLEEGEHIELGELEGEAEDYLKSCESHVAKPEDVHSLVSF